MVEEKIASAQPPVPPGQEALEQAVLACMVCAARPENAIALQAQVESAAVKDRNITPVGFYTDFDVPAGVRRFPRSKYQGIAHMVLEDEGLNAGVRFSNGSIATFMLGISVDQQGGLLSHLEGQMLEVEPWPSDVSKFEIIE